MSVKEKREQCKRYCCVYGCRNKINRVTDLSFFNVPKEDERRREWLTIIDREDLLDEKKLYKPKYNYVCSAHFDDSAIICSITKRLKNDAVPTKFLPKAGNQTKTIINNDKSTQTDLNETFNKNTQTTRIFSGKSPTVNKRKRIKMIKIGKCKDNNLKQEISDIQKKPEAKNSSLPTVSNDEDQFIN